MRKKDLAILLSQLAPLTTYSATLEQYPTDPNIAADMLWIAHHHSSFAGKTVADFGCGNGILGIGALLLGAHKVLFVDIDEKALSVARENVAFAEHHTGNSFSSLFCQSSITAFSSTADLVFQNPPFGVQKEHADKTFLTAALRCAPLVYSLHKIESNTFLSAFAKDHRCSATLLTSYELPLRHTQSFHTKKRYLVSVGLWRIEKLKKKPSDDFPTHGN